MWFDTHFLCHTIQNFRWYDFYLTGAFWKKRNIFQNSRACFSWLVPIRFESIYCLFCWTTWRCHNSVFQPRNGLLGERKVNSLRSITFWAPHTDGSLCWPLSQRIIPWNVPRDRLTLPIACSRGKMLIKRSESVFFVFPFLFAPLLFLLAHHWLLRCRIPLEASVA